MKKQDFKEKLKGKLRDYIQYVLIGVSLLFIVSLATNMIRLRNAGEKVGEVQDRVEDLKKERDGLEARAVAVEADRFVEQQLRDNLGLAQEGEIVVVLPEDEILRKLAPKENKEEETLPNPNWKKWVNLFFYKIVSN